VYAQVRRVVKVNGMSERQAPRESGLSSKAIRKQLACAVLLGSSAQEAAGAGKVGAPGPRNESSGR
jgi:hypothetical protein